MGLGGYACIFVLLGNLSDNVLIATSFLPQVEQGAIKLLHHVTWSMIDE